MKACYQKVKTALNSASPSTMNRRISTSPLSRRHAKCLTPPPDFTPRVTQRRSRSWSLNRNKKENTPKKEEEKENGKCQVLAEIRATPLSLAHLRDATPPPRSSYIINSKLREYKNKGLQRSRSLSPEILKKTGRLPLKSPNLVRSVSSLQTNAAKRRYLEMRKGRSLIPIPITILPAASSPSSSAKDKLQSAHNYPRRSYYSYSSSLYSNYYPYYSRASISSSPTSAATLLSSPKLQSRSRNSVEWRRFADLTPTTAKATTTTTTSRPSRDRTQQLPPPPPPLSPPCSPLSLARLRNAGSSEAGFGSPGFPPRFFRNLPPKLTRLTSSELGVKQHQHQQLLWNSYRRRAALQRGASRAELSIQAKGSSSLHNKNKSNGKLRSLKMDMHSPQPQNAKGFSPFSFLQRKNPKFSPLWDKSKIVPESSIYSEPYQHQIQVQPRTVRQKLPITLKNSIPRGLSRQSTASSSMFDDDPGIMSEAETSSTGMFRRGGKSRSSLPVVKTPNKTLEKPLGLVFLQYRGETKRALLPNEITSLDTVKALFVRSFPRQLSLDYMDAMGAKIYVHDGAKDIFYELEDLRDISPDSRNRFDQIQDRSVLRLFEPHMNGNGPMPTGPVWDHDQSYFSEPEFDSDYQHQHVHKTKGSKGGPYNMNYNYPVGATLPRGRPYSPAVIHKPGLNGPPPPKPLRLYPSSSTSSLSLIKRPSTPGGGNPSATSPNPIYAGSRMSYSLPLNNNNNSTYSNLPPDPRMYHREIYSAPAEPTYISSLERARYVEDPYYAQFSPRSGSITPIIDEEARFRMEHMERQLYNLTGMVKAIYPGQQQPNPQQHPVRHASTLPRNLIGASATSNYVTHRDYIPSRDSYRDDIDKLSSSSSASLPDDPVIIRPDAMIQKAPKFGKEKSVSFSDDQPDGRVYSPNVQTVERPSKPAIKSTTLPRMNQGLRVVPGPPQGAIQPKTHGANLVNTTYAYYGNRGGDLGLNPEHFNQLRTLQKKAKELKGDCRMLRRSVQTQAHTIRETLRETFLRFKVAAMAGNDQWLQGDPGRGRIHRDEEIYKQEMIKLDRDLTELEINVEDMRTLVINKKSRVNMSEVENMALILSKASKTTADLKARFPSLHESVKVLLNNEMDRYVVEERFLKEEPERLEIALKRCKKLTGTLVTLKRLASVQEQRVIPSLDSPRSSPQLQNNSEAQMAMTNLTNSVATETQPNPSNRSFATSNSSSAFSPTFGDSSNPCPETTLNELLDELAQPHISSPPHTIITKSANRLCPEPPKRLPSYPSTESGGSPVKIWTNQQTTEYISGPQPKTHPPLPPKPAKVPPPPPPRTSSKSPLISPSIESSESSESINSQEASHGSGSRRSHPPHQQHSKLTQRHEELLRKQKLLQDQYSRLQKLQRSGKPNNGTSNHDGDEEGENNGIPEKEGAVKKKPELKKTGSESNIRVKFGTAFSTVPSSSTGSLTNISKPQTLYETDIL